MEATHTRSVAPVHSGGLAVARIVSLIGTVVAGLIVVGILLIVFEANAGNAIVEFFTDAARWLSTPFHGLFDVDGRKWQIGLNWGIAAIVYLAISRLVARLLAR